jgi:hypothetical protein
MKSRTIYNNKLKTSLHKTLNTVEGAKLTMYRNRTLRYSLREQYPFIDTMPKELITNFIQDLLYLDRRLRKATENVDKSNKKRLATRTRIDLGYSH